MTRRRLPWLVAAMVALLLPRVYQWSDQTRQVLLVDPVRRASSITEVRHAAGPGTTSSSGKTTAMAVRDIDVDEPRNAFAVRSVPPVTPAPTSALSVVAAVAKPLPRAVTPVAVTESAPPLQVIGTWDDGNGPTVFLVGSGRTVQARVGDLVLATYRVTSITAQTVTLIHAASQQEVRLVIPSAASPSFNSAQR